MAGPYASGFFDCVPRDASDFAQNDGVWGMEEMGDGGDAEVATGHVFRLVDAHHAQERGGEVAEAG